jgi:hypothetical protein
MNKNIVLLKTYDKIKGKVCIKRCKAAIAHKTHSAPVSEFRFSKNFVLAAEWGFYEDKQKIAWFGCTRRLSLL